MLSVPFHISGPWYGGSCSLLAFRLVHARRSVSFPEYQGKVTAIRAVACIAKLCSHFIVFGASLLFEFASSQSAGKVLDPTELVKRVLLDLSLVFRSIRQR